MPSTLTTARPTLERAGAAAWPPRLGGAPTSSLLFSFCPTYLRVSSPTTTGRWVHQSCVRPVLPGARSGAHQVPVRRWQISGIARPSRRARVKPMPVHAHSSPLRRHHRVESQFFDVQAALATSVVRILRALLQALRWRFYGRLRVLRRTVVTVGGQPPGQELDRRNRAIR